MGRNSVKENKNIYQRSREALGLTREKAEELLQGLTAERIEKIENERSGAHPDEVLLMAEGYKVPELCNYYCANECPIGRRYVPPVETKDLSRIVLEMLASLNKMQHHQEKLIAITADGAISGSELDDFVTIQQELEKISLSVESLQLWAEKKMADGSIDPKEYKRTQESLKKQ